MFWVVSIFLWAPVYQITLPCYAGWFQGIQRLLLLLSPWCSSTFSVLCSDIIWVSAHSGFKLLGNKLDGVIIIIFTVLDKYNSRYYVLLLYQGCGWSAKQTIQTKGLDSWRRETRWVSWQKEPREGSLRRERQSRTDSRRDQSRWVSSPESTTVSRRKQWGKTSQDELAFLVAL